MHFIHCKQALFYIANVIGKPSKADHASAAINRPSMARVLIEYDVS